MPYKKTYKTFNFNGKQTADVPDLLLSPPYFKKLSNFVYNKQGSITSKKPVKSLTGVENIENKENIIIARPSARPVFVPPPTPQAPAQPGQTNPPPTPPPANTFQYSGRFRIPTHGSRPISFYNRRTGSGAVSSEIGLVNGFLPNTKIYINSLFFIPNIYAFATERLFTVIRFEAAESNYASLSAFQTDMSKILSMDVGDSSFQRITLPTSYANSLDDIGYIKFARLQDGFYRCTVINNSSDPSVALGGNPLPNGILSSVYWDYSARTEDTFFTLKLRIA